MLTRPFGFDISILVSGEMPRDANREETDHDTLYDLEQIRQPNGTVGV